DSLRTGLEQFCAVRPPSHAGDGRSVRFVADLHHAHVCSCRTHRGQSVRRVAVERPATLLQTHLTPGTRGVLLPGMCPEVRIMEVDQHLHTRLGRAPCDLGGPLGIDVTAAVALGRVGGGVGLVPHPHTHPVHTGVSQHVEQVCLVTFEIVEGDAALLQGEHAGDVHAVDPVRAHPLYFGHRDPGFDG